MKNSKNAAFILNKKNPKIEARKPEARKTFYVFLLYTQNAFFWHYLRAVFVNAAKEQKCMKYKIVVLRTTVLEVTYNRIYRIDHVVYSLYMIESMLIMATTFFNKMQQNIFGHNLLINMQRRLLVVL